VEFGELADDAVGRRPRGPAAIGEQVEDPTKIARTAPPCGASRPNHDLVGRVVDDVPDFAAVLGLERDPVEGIGAVPGDVGESGVLIDAEVVAVVDPGDEFGVARRV
jgi:hypothetical protein